MDKKTALYIRVSTQDQRHDSQLRELKETCRVRRWNQVVHYVEKESGAKASRPQLNKLMTDMRAGKVARVVAYKLDRLGRSLTHLALMLDEMNRLRVPLICASQGIDTSDENPAGKLQLGVLMAVAEFERSLIRERVNAGLAAARARGVRLGRPRTLDGRAKEVRALMRRGLGVRAIARELKMPASSVQAVLEWIRA
jgi:DNA invertase Pin-like site-specific DNA recombinase